MVYKEQKTLAMLMPADAIAPPSGMSPKIAPPMVKMSEQMLLLLAGCVSMTAKPMVIVESSSLMRAIDKLPGTVAVVISPLELPPLEPPAPEPVFICAEPCSALPKPSTKAFLAHP